MTSRDDTETLPPPPKTRQERPEFASKRITHPPEDGVQPFVGDVGNSRDEDERAAEKHRDPPLRGRPRCSRGASISLPSVARPSSTSLDPWLCVPASRRVLPYRGGGFPVFERVLPRGGQGRGRPVRGRPHSGIGGGRHAVWTAS